MMTRLTSIAVAVVVARATAADAQAVNIDAGATKAKEVCAACHGADGVTTLAEYPEVYTVPRIAGQHEAYLVKALQEYKSGDRSNPSMRAIASLLSNQDMADVAAYYGQSGPTTGVK